MADGVRQETFSVALPDGATVALTLHRPESPRWTVLGLPALGVPASYYQPLAAALAARGAAAAVADLRGNGTSSVRAGRGVDFGYADLVADTRAIAAGLAARTGRPLALLGHSLGGHVSALLAGLSPDVPQRLVLVACGTPYWRRFPGTRSLGVLALANLARWSGSVLGHFPGEQIGFGGREAARLMREWSTLARTGRLQVRGLDAEAALAAVTTPSLVLSIGGDRMAPRAAVEHLAGKLVAAPVDRGHLGRDRAESRALDHFRWARYPTAVADTVVAWLDEARPPREGL